MAVDGYVDVVKRSAPPDTDPELWFGRLANNYARLAGAAYTRIVILIVGALRRNEDGSSYANCVIELPLSAVAEKRLLPADLLLQDGFYLGECYSEHYAIGEHGNLFWNTVGVDPDNMAFADARLVSVWHFIYRKLDDISDLMKLVRGPYTEEE